MILDVHGNVVNELEYWCFIVYRYPSATIDDAKHLPYIDKLKIGKYPPSPQTPEGIIEQFENDEVKNRFGKYYKGTQDDNNFSFTFFYSQKWITIFYSQKKIEIYWLTRHLK